MKGKVYKTNPHTKNELKEVAAEERSRVDSVLFKRHRKQHFQHLLRYISVNVIAFIEHQQNLLWLSPVSYICARESASESCADVRTHCIIIIIIIIMRKINMYICKQDVSFGLGLSG
jgi:hypothetical protein